MAILKVKGLKSILNSIHQTVVGGRRSFYYQKEQTEFELALLRANSTSRMGGNFYD